MRVPESSLLDRYGGIDAQGRYVSKIAGTMHAMSRIGQRLFTGRVAVAQARRAALRRSRNPSHAALRRTARCAVPNTGAAAPCRRR